MFHPSSVAVVFDLREIRAFVRSHSSSHWQNESISGDEGYSIVMVKEMLMKMIVAMMEEEMRREGKLRDCVEGQHSDKMKRGRSEGKKEEREYKRTGRT